MIAKGIDAGFASKFITNSAAETVLLECLKYGESTPYDGIALVNSAKNKSIW